MRDKHQTHQLFEAELTAPFSGEWTMMMQLELPIANAAISFTTAIVQLDCGGVASVISKKPGLPRQRWKDPRRATRSVPADRACFQHCVVGVLQNGTRLIEKSAAGVSQADGSWGAFE